MPRLAGPVSTSGSTIDCDDCAAAPPDGIYDDNDRYKSEHGGTRTSTPSPCRGPWQLRATSPPSSSSSSSSSAYDDETRRRSTRSTDYLFDEAGDGRCPYSPASPGALHTEHDSRALLLTEHPSAGDNDLGQRRDARLCPRRQPAQAYDFSSSDYDAAGEPQLTAPQTTAPPSAPAADTGRHYNPLSRDAPTPTGRWAPSREDIFKEDMYWPHAPLQFPERPQECAQSGEPSAVTAVTSADAMPYWSVPRLNQSAASPCGRVGGFEAVDVADGARRTMAVAMDTGASHSLSGIPHKYLYLLVELRTRPSLTERPMDGERCSTPPQREERLASPTSNYVQDSSESETLPRHFQDMKVAAPSVPPPEPPPPRTRTPPSAVVAAVVMRHSASGHTAGSSESQAARCPLVSAGELPLLPSVAPSIATQQEVAGSQSRLSVGGSIPQPPNFDAPSNLRSYY